MNSLRTAAGAIASTVVFGTAAFSAIPAASADDATDVPCATQQAHVDKATAKLAALTAKYAAHPTKHNQKAKKAQVQRLSHAASRLDTCLAAQPV
jgi:hypothetical protein